MVLVAFVAFELPSVAGFFAVVFVAVFAVVFAGAFLAGAFFGGVFFGSAFVGLAFFGLAVSFVSGTSSRGQFFNVSR